MSSIEGTRAPPTWFGEFLRGKLLRAGLAPDQIQFSHWSHFASLTHVPNVILALGEESLTYLTDKKGIDKWHLSPLDAREVFNCRKVIPTFDQKRIQADPHCGLYLELACRRIAEESGTKEFVRTPERFRLNPELGETLAVLKMLRDEPIVSVDVETGNGQINTVGFAWSESDAIAINVLPDRLGDSNYYELWEAIAAVIESSSAKVFQNFIYDMSYFSAYGLRVGGEIFDTMWAMKFLWPELEMGLDNVGRLYTKRPYWKDDGRKSEEAGKRKDWGNIRDWERHYTYNCRDTTGTFEAATNQRTDLNARGFDSLWTNFISRFCGPLLEMCSTGIAVSTERRAELTGTCLHRIQELTARLPEGLNPRSPKQVLAHIKGRGFAVPRAFDRKKGESRESTDKKALKRLRIKYPEEPLFQTLMDLSTLSKLKSAYLDAEICPDGRLRYSLNGHGTETGRWSGGKDPWGRGFNIQTLPHEKAGLKLKSMLISGPGRILLEVDLRQAESRFVAYDSADATLMRMLDSNEDIHSFVAAEIFQKPQGEITKLERQLGKKSGHGANYAMKENTFIETCLAEMDLVLTKKEATNVLEAYHRLFPGIRRWHADIRMRLRTERKLTTPIGRVRYFYGRIGEDMFREGYAYRPQSTIPDVTNGLMLFLQRARTEERLDFSFLVQVHDSLILECADDGRTVPRIAEICRRPELWAPELRLAGGSLRIPTEVKTSRILSGMEELKCATKRRKSMPRNLSRRS